MLHSKLSSHVGSLGTWMLAVGVQGLLLRKKFSIFETYREHRELSIAC